MHRTQAFLILLIGLLFLHSQTYAQVEIGGYIRSDIRMRLQTKGNPFTWNENRICLQLKARPSEKVQLYSDLVVRGFGFPRTETIDDLQQTGKEKVQPWGLEFYEAYVDMSDFLVEKLDVKIGRQRIAWGTADKFNPTDNLNPKDLQDIFDFGRHLGSNAIKVSYYHESYTLTGVYIPVFTPAVLPPSDWLQAFEGPISLPPGMRLHSLSNAVVLPKNNFNESSMYAFKIATTVADYNVSLNYFKGRDDLPLVTGVTILPLDTLGTVDVNSIMQYPRMQVIGADMAGQIFNIGVWAEAAVFLPRKYNVLTSFMSPPNTQQQIAIALDDKPYAKYVIGGDYTFANGLYVNAQYIHGLFHERGNENLEDYLVFALRQSFLNDALKITFAGGAIEVKDFKDIRNNYAFALGPEIAYYPIDNAELLIGAYIIDGKPTTTFGRVKDNDEVYFKVKYSF
ncbi:MAG: hypothetical protein KKD56_12180 [Acidobacteria bacterium]|nr:hypothetical protein [Acidobacteriota bacterium]MBU1569078.1 hypothetical protein [Pseudomonadota bacterium]MBU2637190.1 hypothetical protein [Bacteroidota bacterium]